MNWKVRTKIRSFSENKYLCQNYIFEAMPISNFQPISLFLRANIALKSKGRLSANTMKNENPSNFALVIEEKRKKIGPPREYPK